ELQAEHPQHGHPLPLRLLVPRLLDVDDGGPVTGWRILCGHVSHLPFELSHVVFKLPLAEAAGDEIKAARPAAPLAGVDGTLEHPPVTAAGVNDVGDIQL